MRPLRWVLVVLACFVSASAPAQTQLELDLATLKAAKMSAETADLIEYFEMGSLKEGDAKELEAQVKNLDHGVYLERQKANKALMQRGAVSLPFLRAALASNPPLELKRRTQECIAAIEATLQPAKIAAAARVLAASKDPRAAEALFNFLPATGTDAFLEEEVLACVGRLAITPDRVDPLLLNALKDPFPFRRDAAAYLIGRRASTEYRDLLRGMLADDNARVTQRVVQGFVGKRPGESVAEARVGDEKLLIDQKIKVSEESLITFLTNRTLSEDDQKLFRALVKETGVITWTARDAATNTLLKEGIKALPFLKEAEFDANAERSRRVRMCLENIRQTNNAAVPIAAVHLLARPPAKKDASPGKLIETLLAYVPFADDDLVEDEVLMCLTLLSLREPKVEPALIAALDDESPARRAAAAYVIGHVGAKDQVALVHPLLDDRHPVVRLRAAQGLLAARDKTALPSFAGLLRTLPEAYLRRAEEVLYRVAEDKAPSDSIVAISKDSRDKAARAWDKWLKDNQAKIDVTNLNERESYLGLITVCEFDIRIGNTQGQIWEGLRNGQKRWTLNGNQPNIQLSGPMDARTLPNGRILVAESNGNQNRVTERDDKGEIKWEVRVPNNPIICQRLPNGNTFIATYNSVMEVTSDKTEVYRITRLPTNQQFHIYGAHKAKNGNIVVINLQGAVVEMDTAGKQINAIQTQNVGNWCGVELLPNGNYLVANMNPGSVREFDRTGKEVWSTNFNGVHRATRLPNGNTLVCAMNTREVAEIDRAGNKVWTTTTQGRPWNVHFR